MIIEDVWLYKKRGEIPHKYIISSDEEDQK
jgi:hypothetical protein